LFQTGKRLPSRPFVIWQPEWEPAGGKLAKLEWLVVAKPSPAVPVGSVAGYGLAQEQDQAANNRLSNTGTGSATDLADPL